MRKGKTSHNCHQRATFYLTRVVSHLARSDTPTLLELWRHGCKVQNAPTTTVCYMFIACIFIYSTKWPYRNKYECQKYEKNHWFMRMRTRTSPAILVTVSSAVLGVGCHTQGQPDGQTVRQPQVRQIEYDSRAIIKTWKQVFVNLT